MPCVPFRSSDGEISGFACTRGSSRKRCAVCGSPATIACDWPLQGLKVGQTCDRALCRRCATRIRPNVDYCPAHARMASEQQGKVGAA